MNRASVSPPASTRPRAGGACALGLIALCASACSLSQNGVNPPSDTFFYPTAGTMVPPPGKSGLSATDSAYDWLYVANSNADLRFNDGTLLMLNVGETDLPAPTKSYDGLLHGAAKDRAMTWSQCPQEDYVNPLPRSDAPICCRDLLDPNIINCDERRYTADDATVLIGSFAAQMVWQSFCQNDPCTSPADCATAPAAGRLLIGVRGDTSLTDVDVAPVGWPTSTSPHPMFHCTAGDSTLATSLTECTQKVIDTLSNLNAFNMSSSVPQLSLPDEPYALTLDSRYDPNCNPNQTNCPDGHGYLYVGHLVGNTSTQDSGGLSLFDISGTASIPAPAFPPLPNFIAPFNSPFPPNGSGFFGVTDLHLHEPLGAGPGSSQEIYVSSRYLPLVSSMIPFGPPVCAGDDNDDVLLPSGDTLNSGLVGSEMRGVAFVDPPKSSPQTPPPTNPNPPNAPGYAAQVYAQQRVPPALVGFDIGQNESNAITVTPSSSTETCSSPTFLYQYPPSENGYSGGTADNPVRLYVNCFDTGEVYIFDPNGPTLITTLEVGRGPAGLVFDSTRPVAYVLNFTQNDVSVIDLAPGSATQYHVVQRLGFPTVTPR